MKTTTQRVFEKARKYEAGMSIRAKVFWSLCLLMALVMPVVSLSLYYIDGMRQTVNYIIQTDEEIAKVINVIEQNVFKAKIAERDYLLLREESSVEAYREAMKLILTEMEKTEFTIILTEEPKTFSAGEQGEPKNKVAGERSEQNGFEQIAPMFQQVINLLKQYQDTFDKLILDSSGETWDIQAQYLEDKIFDGISEYKRNYTKLIARARRADSPEERNQRFKEAKNYADSLDQIIWDAMIYRTPNQEQMIANLEQQREKILVLAGNISSQSRSHAQMNRQLIERLSARATRNIITTLMLTSLIVIYMIVFLPKSIVKPIRQLTRIIKQAENGDLTVSAQTVYKDEVGELARFFNRFIAQIKKLDSLKSQKIREIYNQFTIIANRLDAWIVIVNDKNIITFVNNKVVESSGVSAHELIDKPLSAFLIFGELAEQVEAALRNGKLVSSAERSLGTHGTTIEVKFRNHNGETRKLRGWFEAMYNPVQEVIGGVIYLEF